MFLPDEGGAGRKRASRIGRPPLPLRLARARLRFPFNLSPFRFESRFHGIPEKDAADEKEEVAAESVSFDGLIRELSPRAAPPPAVFGTEEEDPAATIATAEEEVVAVGGGTVGAEALLTDAATAAGLACFSARLEPPEPVTPLSETVVAVPTFKLLLLLLLLLAFAAAFFCFSCRNFHNRSRSSRFFRFAAAAASALGSD